MLTKYIDSYPYNEPIFIDDIKEYFKNFIKDNELEMEKIFEYANKINNLKPIRKLYELGGKNIDLKIHI